MPEDGSRVISTSTKPLRILLVEDNALLAMLYAELLADMGHVVCAIESTEPDAIAAAARCKPDLMMVDGGLRKGSGISAVSEILKSGFVPHLFVTGDARAVQMSRPHAVILEKPFREPDLALAIQSALDATPASQG